MIIGFTGTRWGMTDAQKRAVSRWLLQLLAGGASNPDEIHHGDCYGSDDEFANMVHTAHPLTRIVCHPPEDETHRAFNPHSDEMREPLSHFARNREIVAAAEVVIGTPREMTRQERGGTWYTLDMAKKRSKSIVVFWPNGDLSAEDDQVAFGRNV